MKTWLSFFLPKDEYKEKRMLQFIAEGGIVLFAAVFILFFVNRFFTVDTEIALFSAVAVFLLYVTGRYTLSGIEYANVATKNAFRRELRFIFTRTFSFVISFLLTYMLLVEFPKTWNHWVDILGLAVTTGMVWIVASYISLKKSYEKNKELV